MKQDMQRQQVRELLAKQTLHRQKQKEEKERMMRAGEAPLQHWGPEEQTQFPHGGFSIKHGHTHSKPISHQKRYVTLGRHAQREDCGMIYGLHPN